MNKFSFLTVGQFYKIDFRIFSVMIALKSVTLMHIDTSELSKVKKVKN